jgi:SAM-dependent methyltransferase
LSLADLRAAIADSWEHYGQDEHDVLAGLQPWEREHYARFLRPRDRIFLIGCGTGRDLIALLGEGYRVEGLDPAPRAIASARRTLDRLGLTAPLHTAAIEDFTPPGRFDVFAFSAFAYSYVPQSRRRVETLARLARHLEPDGRILVTYVPAAARRRLPFLLTRAGSWLTGSDWRPEPGDAVAASAPRRRTVHYQHDFAEGEIEGEVEAAGLRVIFHRRASEGVLVLTAPPSGNGA